MNDILIKNGTVIDGKKTPMFKADISIKNGKIALIKAGLRSQAATVIDATGMYVAPGFIDITNHSDTHWTIFSVPSQESLLRQGITTILGGVCGSSLAPLVASEHIASIQKWTDTKSVNLNWLSLQEFFEELRRHSLGVNFATLVGHGTLRRDILGDSVRPPDRDELGRMKFLLAGALRDGARGISFGLAFSHGRPAGDEELTQLSQVAADAHSFVSLHLRDEGKDLLPSLTEAIRIVRSSGVSLEIAHFKALGREAWGDLPKALQLIRRAREEGLAIDIDVFPYTKTGSLLYALLPPWARDGGKKGILERLRDLQQRRLLLDHLERATLHYDHVTIASAAQEKSIVGKSITAIASRMNLTPTEALIEILISNELGVTIFGETIQESDMITLIKEPYAMISSDSYGLDETAALSGDIAHPRSFGATARFLGTYVREQGIVPWEEAVFKLSGAPAEKIGLTDRGRVESKAAADLVIFDPATIRDNATFENPFQYPSGIAWVLVNGEIAVEKGTYTGKKPGRILEKE